MDSQLHPSGFHQREARFCSHQGSSSGASHQEGFPRAQETGNGWEHKSRGEIENTLINRQKQHGEQKHSDLGEGEKKAKQLFQNHLLLVCYQTKICWLIFRNPVKFPFQNPSQTRTLFWKHNPHKQNTMQHRQAGRSWVKNWTSSATLLKKGCW